MNTCFDTRMALQRGIYGAMCVCGHLKEEHTERRGHGSCCNTTCECARFTWKRFIDKQERLNYIRDQEEKNGC